MSAQSVTSCTSYDPARQRLLASGFTPRGGPKRRTRLVRRTAPRRTPAPWGDARLARCLVCAAPATLGVRAWRDPSSARLPRRSVCLARRFGCAASGASHPSTRPMRVGGIRSPDARLNRPICRVRIPMRPESSIAACLVAMPAHDRIRMRWSTRRRFRPSCGLRMPATRIAEGNAARSAKSAHRSGLDAAQVTQATQAGRCPGDARDAGGTRVLGARLRRSAVDGWIHALDRVTRPAMMRA